MTKLATIPTSLRGGTKKRDHYRQEQQNVLKLKSVGDTNWRQLVDLIHNQGYQASDSAVGALLGYTTQQIPNSTAEISAARSNMNNVVRNLHDPNSTLLNGSLEALQNGNVVIVDISLLSASAGNNIAGLLMRKIFSYNQEHFTGNTSSIPVIAVIEEAQSVLGKRLDESSPFVEWTKEGRKYDLGAILITQQPGSMAPELLSQADNWFSFHLLSEGDAGTLGKYNSHYSHDILAHLIGEPIQGNCYMWSAPKQPFVLPVRIRNFDELYRENVKSDITELPFSQSPAKAIREQAQDRYKNLADILLEKLKATSQSTKTTADGYTGLNGGQLFKIIESIKKDDNSIIQSENNLKMPLFSKMLNVSPDQVQVRQIENKEYFCVLTADWNKVFPKPSGLFNE